MVNVQENSTPIVTEKMIPLNRSNSRVIIGLVILFLVVGYVSFYLGMKMINNIPVAYKNNLNPTSIQTATNTFSTDSTGYCNDESGITDLNIRKYYNKDLGIYFDVPTDWAVILDKGCMYEYDSSLKQLQLHGKYILSRSGGAPSLSSPEKIKEKFKGFFIQPEFISIYQVDNKDNLSLKSWIKKNIDGGNGSTVIPHKTTEKVIGNMTFITLSDFQEIYLFTDTYFENKGNIYKVALYASASEFIRDELLKSIASYNK